MYCKSCKYDLRGLGEGRNCPECGAPFDPGKRETFLAALPAPLTTVKRARDLILLIAISSLIAFLIMLWAAVASDGH
jgi:hypothetical protein